AFQDLRCLVGRSAIDNDVLYVGILLVKYGENGLLEVLALVEGRRHHRNSGPRLSAGQGSGNLSRFRIDVRPLAISTGAVIPDRKLTTEILGDIRHRSVSGLRAEFREEIALVQPALNGDTQVSRRHITDSATLA